MENLSVKELVRLSQRTWRKYKTLNRTIHFDPSFFFNYAHGCNTRKC